MLEAFNLRIDDEMISLFLKIKKQKAFDFSLPFPGQALSLWLMSSEQGLRVTAVVTDSYGLSSSSGRKTSRDGEVTISAAYFESCRTTELKKNQNKPNIIQRRKRTINSDRNGIHWAQDKPALNCIIIYVLQAYTVLLSIPADS